MLFLHNLCPTDVYMPLESWWEGVERGDYSADKGQGYYGFEDAYTNIPAGFVRSEYEAEIGSIEPHKHPTHVIWVPK